MNPVAGMDSGFALQFLALLVMPTALAADAAFWNSAARMGRLGLRYRFVTRYGFDTATVRVPVPGGDRDEGERVARALGPGND